MKNFIDRKLDLDHLNKIALFIIFIIGITVSQRSFSQTVEESLRAMSQSEDIKQADATQKICHIICNEEYKKNAFNNNPNTMIILNNCSNQCIQTHNRIMACITNQITSQYKSSRCQSSPNSESNKNYSEEKFTELSFSIELLILIISLIVVIIFTFSKELKLNKLKLNFNENFNSKGKNIFCHECGSKQPHKSKYCNQCQTKLEL